MEPLIFPNLRSSNTADRLYNASGDLYWNGSSSAPLPSATGHRRAAISIALPAMWASAPLRLIGNYRLLDKVHLTTSRPIFHFTATSTTTTFPYASTHRSHRLRQFLFRRSLFGNLERRGGRRDLRRHRPANFPP